MKQKLEENKGIPAFVTVDTGHYIRTFSGESVL